MKGFIIFFIVIDLFLSCISTVKNENSELIKEIAQTRIEGVESRLVLVDTKNGRTEFILNIINNTNRSLFIDSHLDASYEIHILPDKMLLVKMPSFALLNFSISRHSLLVPILGKIDPHANYTQHLIIDTKFESKDAFYDDNSINEKDFENSKGIICSYKIYYEPFPKYISFEDYHNIYLNKGVGISTEPYYFK